MKAFVLDRYGRNEVLRAADVPEPEVRDDDVLIQVHATAVNQLDSKLRNGDFKLILPYRPPFILGHDVAGVVLRVGQKVRRFKAGDEVYARPDDFRIGTFAERIAVKEASVAIKPTNTSMEEAASIPLAGLTAWQALVEGACLRKGEKVFIQAGSGGVGTFAIQLAKFLGAAVATTASAGSTGLVESLGADVIIDYRKDAFEKQLSGYDVVLNSQDTKTLTKSLGVLKSGGRLVSISGPPDPRFAEALTASWIVKQVVRAISFNVRRQARRRHIDYAFLFMKASGEQLGQITPLIESGAIRPVLDKVFPFESTNEALRHIDTGRAKGKVVIKLR